MINDSDSLIAELNVDLTVIKLKISQNNNPSKIFKSKQHSTIIVMQKLDEIIDIYLKMETNYALMITGDWGVGKTHYYKNTLTPKISEVPVFINNKKKYKPILVSLFGLKSLEEIQSAIFLNLFPFLQNKKVKISATLGKLIAKGILYYKGFGEYASLLEEINPKNGASFVSTEDIVICFDDLERISPNLHLEEFIGYVNSLVENENVKVLIIANDDKIEKEKYLILKEKVIGNSVEFTPTLDESFSGIIKEKFSQSRPYIQYLEANSKFILKMFSKGSTNLRTLIFILNYFQRIFSEVSNNLFFKEEEILHGKKDEILLDLIKFSIAVSIEYKQGIVSFKDKKELDNHSYINWPAFQFNQEYKRTYNPNRDINEESPKSYRELFQERYYNEETYSFYGSVYDYLTGGDSFSYERLVNDLKRIHHIKDNVVIPHYEVYDNLKYPICFSLSDKQYISETRKLLNFAYEGKYSLEKSLNIFHFITRFNNPLKLDIAKFRQKLILGLKRGKDDYQYNRDLNFDLRLINDTDYRIDEELVKSAALEINDEILKATNSKRYLELQETCYSDFEKFKGKVLSNDSDFSFEPIFSEFNPIKFYSFFHNSSPEHKWEIVRFFENRYKDFKSSEFIKEIDFFSALQKRIKSLKRFEYGNSVSGFVLLEFEKVLTKTIKYLQNK